MCLLKDKKVRNNHHKEDGYCIAYKIVQNHNHSPFMNDFQYKVGVNIPEKNSSEKNRFSMFAFSGLHLFLSLKEAKAFASNQFKYELIKKLIKIIKVFYKPEDVLFYGHTIDAAFQYAKKNGRSVVVKSCLVKSLEDVCFSH
jgi:hypothetical protein